jgi:hypothetical protein
VAEEFENSKAGVQGPVVAVVVRGVGGEDHRGDPQPGPRPSAPPAGPAQSRGRRPACPDARARCEWSSVAAGGPPPPGTGCERRRVPSHPRGPACCRRSTPITAGGSARWRSPATCRGKMPLADDSGVLKSACASIHTMPQRLRSIPASTPMHTSHDPAKTTGSCRAATAACANGRSRRLTALDADGTSIPTSVPAGTSARRLVTRIPPPANSRSAPARTYRPGPSAAG